MSKAQFIHKLFQGLAPRYDLFNRISSLGLVTSWHRRLLQEARFKPHAKILDLCTGTGEIALGFRRVLTNGALVVGLDFSENMLIHAHAKAQQEGLTNVWVDGSASGLPFKESSFDGVTMGFAMRNMESAPATIQEIHRVLKTDGQVFILELGRPFHPVLRSLHRFWLLSFVRGIGMFLRGKKEPFEYLAQSIYEFFEPKVFMAELTRQGFEQVHYVPLHNGIAGIYVAIKKCVNK
jgi:demethylmenaquinone methyltransferase / 2-methoxy-6-polyprenyl-1,4-benzoquinol methylase